MITKSRALWAIVAIVCAIASIAIMIAIRNAPKFETIQWDATMVSEVQDHDGYTVTVCGYMSTSSPYDETCAFLKQVPISPDLFTSSDAEVIDTIVCYPAYGQRMSYTDKCIRVTGEIIGTPMEKDCFEMSYPFYLVNCTVEEVAPTEAIQSYHYMLDDGTLSTLNEYLSATYDTMDGDEVSVISEELKDKLLNISVDYPSTELSSVVNTVQELYTAAVVVCEGKLSTETPEYGTMVEKHTALTNALTAWFDTLKVGGNE